MKRKKFNEQEREEILAKTNNRCGYCGSLSKKLEIDHKTPFESLVFHGIKDDNPDNWVACCVSCNRYKGCRNTEEFRELIETTDERLIRDNTAYRIGKRFGVVGTLAQGVLFYFENKTATTIKEIK